LNFDLFASIIDINTQMPVKPLTQTRHHPIIPRWLIIKAKVCGDKMQRFSVDLTGKKGHLS